MSGPSRPPRPDPPGPHAPKRRRTARAFAARGTAALGAALASIRRAIASRRLAIALVIASLAGAALLVVLSGGEPSPTQTSEPLGGPDLPVEVEPDAEPGGPAGTPTSP